MFGSEELSNSIGMMRQLSAPPDASRHIEEAMQESEELQKRYKEWVTLHPERAKEVAKYAKVGEQRAVEFEDDGTVDALLLAFMRDVTIRAQDPERELPPGVQS